MNKDVSKRVIELLNDQIILQSKITSVSKSVQSAICSRDLPTIELALSELDNLTEQSDRLESERIKTITDCEEIPQNRKKLTQILPFLPKDTHKELLSLKDKLQNILMENRKISISNKIHLEENLSSIHSLVLSLSGARSKSIRYSSLGKGEQGVRHNLLNRVG